MSWFRSEEMTLCQLFLQSEAAYTCVSELGELGLVQFRDLNPDVSAFQRKFVNEIRRCEEMERKLRFLEKEIKKDCIPMLDTGDNPDAPAPREMIDLEATFEKLENEMKEVNGNSEALKKNFLELTELKHILRKTQTFFEEAEFRRAQAMHDSHLTDENLGLLGEDAQRTGQALRLGFVAGVILRERIPTFERMLWRACRGNVFLRQTEIDHPLEDPVTGDHVDKSVFIIFFQGDQLKSRVKKICEGFRATLYPCPETPSERREMSMGVMTRIEDLNTVLGQTQDHRHRVLVAAAKNIKVWFIKVRKIKAIYHTLNMFNLDVTQKCLIAECWCAVADLENIQLALRRGNETSGSSVPSILNRMPSKEEPPTYNRTNKFTQVFQSIVDAYGVANYREVNPAPFFIISFPFLFAVMFGDCGHGIIMALFAAWMIWREKQLHAKRIQDEIFNTFFGGRYIIFLMGIFSIYTGLLYNDCFSKSLNIFGTSWYASPKPYSADVLEKYKILQLNPNGSFYTLTPYPFGVDPIWAMSKNKISFFNSLKMKLSVICGVSHMLFGVGLSLHNHRFFGKTLNIICEFIPQVIFMFCMFGYLIILIFYKWCNFTSELSQEAPSLLIGMINMFLFNYPDAENVDISAKFFVKLEGLQKFLVVVAMLCVPWLLLVKPFYMRRQHRLGQLPRTTVPVNGVPEEQAEVVHYDSSNPCKETEPEKYKHQPLSVQSGDVLNHDPEQEVIHHVQQQSRVTTNEPEKPFEFGELMIHQTIHTIEYCLGCISHTASYLRLWALSLAHNQLSEVLWTMVMKIGLSAISGVGGSVVLVFIFAFWAVLTIAVLVVMEGLSAFLHALRLHWVEFQTKFYSGNGYIFVPFSFETMLETGSEELK